MGPFHQRTLLASDKRFAPLDARSAGFSTPGTSPYITQQELSDLCYSAVDELLPFFMLPLDPEQNILRVRLAADTADNETLFQCCLDPCN